MWHVVCKYSIKGPSLFSFTPPTTTTYLAIWGYFTAYKIELSQRICSNILSQTERRSDALASLTVTGWWTRWRRDCHGSRVTCDVSRAVTPIKSEWVRQYININISKRGHNRKSGSWIFLYLTRTKARCWEQQSSMQQLSSWCDSDYWWRRVRYISPQLLPCPPPLSEAAGCVSRG